MSAKCPYMTKKYTGSVVVTEPSIKSSLTPKILVVQTTHPLVDLKVYIAAVYVHAIILNKISLSSTGSNDSAPESTYDALGK